MRVLVLGEVDSFRHIVARALRSHGVEAIEADVGREGLTALEGERPDIVIIHLQPGAIYEEYFQRISVASGNGRIVVVEESGPLRLRARAPESVSFLSRRELRELVQAVCRPALAAHD